MARRRTKIRRVALLTVPSAVLNGISRFVGPDSSWTFELCYPTPKTVRQLASEPPDGIIAYLHSEEIAAAVGRVGCPVVNHSGVLGNTGLPRVTCDSYVAGRMAADHFLERGFNEFAFVGDDKRAFDAERASGFADRVGESGHSCVRYPLRMTVLPTSRERSAKTDRELTKWLHGLPRPTAVFAANDWLAWWVTELARTSGIRVPEELAVMGMDNTVVCRISRPPLSSIRYPSERVGYEAARALERMMSGRPSNVDMRIPPDGIVTRQSTDILAIEDPTVAMAVRFIRDHFADNIGVDDVARAACMNRRTMEKRFRAIIGRSPAAEIRRVRIAAAKELLLQHEVPIDEVAKRSGFSSRRWMSTVFSAAAGTTPGRFRKEHSVARQSGSEGEPVL
jgi:LacI family transcriptional regulator